MLSTSIEIFFGGLMLGGIFALLAVGFSLQYGVARVLNIGHGEFIMVGAFIAWSLVAGWSFHPLLTLLIVAPLLFVLGYALYWTLFRSLKNKAPSPAVFEGNSLLVAFGLLFIIQSLAITIWGTTIRGYSFMAYSVEIFDMRFSANRLLILVFAVALCVIFYLFLTRTRLGKAIRASAQDPEAAGLMGVDINRMLSLCFGLGAMMAGLAGAFYTMAYQIEATMGLQYTIIALVVVVLGGLGSILGSLLGGFILGVIGSIVNSIEPGLTLAAYYALFMILLLVKPTGLFGR